MCDISTDLFTFLLNVFFLHLQTEYYKRINWPFRLPLNNIRARAKAVVGFHISSPVLEIASDFWADLLLNLVRQETASAGFCVLSRSELISLSRHKTWPEKRTMHASLQKAINMLSKIQNWQSMSLFSTSFYWQRWQIAGARNTEDDYYISGGAHVHELSVPYQRRRLKEAWKAMWERDYLRYLQMSSPSLWRCASIVRPYLGIKQNYEAFCCGCKGSVISNCNPNTSLIKANFCPGWLLYSISSNAVSL